MKQCLVKINNLGKKYLNDKRFNFNINRSSITLLNGLNGSGKSTLIKLLLGLIKPSYGYIEYANECKISYLPEKVELPKHIHTKNYIEDLKFDYFEYFDQIFYESLAINETVKISKLSKGNKQKLAILKTFSSPANLIILDEPLTALDKKCIKVVTRKIESDIKKGRAFLISTHNINQFKKLKPCEVLV